MQHEFWLQRWQQQQIGFHQQAYNPLLLQYWPQLNTAQGKTVFVPLCGKSLDMQWLAEQGLTVIGNELSALAIEAFWQAMSVSPQRQQRGAFEQSQSGSISLLQGDFFALTEADIDSPSLVFDRAALVALPPQMRQRYVQHLRTILPSKSEILLVTLEKESNVDGGPPFNVGCAEVNELFAQDNVHHLGSVPNNERPDLPCTEHVFKIILK